MAKTRSPAYPAIGLKEAIEKARLVYGADYQNPIPRKVAAQHMGYASLNGKSLGVLSALVKFGLLEGRGDDTRVSDSAVTIIAHPPGATERVEALQLASQKPELFGELDNRFSGGKASDQAIRSYLLTQKFIPAAADSAIRAYRETKQLVEAESGGYSAPEVMKPHQESTVETQRQQTPTPANPHPPGAVPIPSREPYQLTLSRGGLGISGFLTSVTEVDELTRALNAWKGLLARVDDARRPEPVDRIETSEVAKVSLMITSAQRARLRELHYKDDVIANMSPEEAHEILQIS